MFSYGEDNIIDFNNMRGAMGIFAPNHAGKSAILDALAYCIFDKCSRTKMAAAVINNKKNNFSCKLNFEIDGVDYFIERKGKRKNDGGARVDVDFWMIGEDGNPISLNGDQRVYTNKNIRGYLGNYDDFALTALSVQNNNTGFIDKTQTEKKDLLSQFLDISVFEELYHYANEEIKDVQVLLKDFKNTDFSQNLHEENILLTELNSTYSIIEKQKAELLKSEKAVNKKIIEYTSKIIQLDPEVPESPETLEIELKTVTNNIGFSKSKLKKYSKYTTENKEEFLDVKEKLKYFNREKIEKNNTLYEEKNNSLTKITHSIEMMKERVKNKLEIVNQLHSHEYDPECEYCRNNSFVQTAEKAREDLPKLKFESEKLLKSKLDLTEERNGLSESVQQLKDLTTLENKLSLITQYQSEIKVKTVQRESEILSQESRKLIIKRLIEKYYKNKRSILANEKIREKISIKDEELDKVKQTLSDINSNLQTAYSNISVCQKTIENILDSIERAHDLEERLKAYEYYLSAIQRDGVPYELISKILPYVEEEVNLILSQIADFSIQFETDGRNINTFIVYGNEEQWALEMTSGMEKFVSSLAIRVALITVSNLPRPNFLAIDEGFGNLDSGNLNSIFSLFDYLKLNFDFMLVISHIDIMKDATDNLLEISQNKGYSHVVY